MASQIYPNELQINKAHSSDTEAPFLDLDLSITKGILSSKIYYKRVDFHFQTGDFYFLGEMFLAPLPMHRRPTSILGGWGGGVLPKVHLRKCAHVADLFLFCYERDFM